MRTVLIIDDQSAVRDALSLLLSLREIRPLTATMPDEGLALLDEALTRRKAGPYQIQAAIAALHARAKTPADTDWPQIAALYKGLLRVMPTPVVELNAAVAVVITSARRTSVDSSQAPAARWSGPNIS